MGCCRVVFCFGVLGRCDCRLGLWLFVGEEEAGEGAGEVFAGEAGGVFGGGGGEWGGGGVGLLLDEMLDSGFVPVVEGDARLGRGDDGGSIAVHGAKAENGGTGSDVLEEFAGQVAFVV